MLRLLFCSLTFGVLCICLDAASAQEERSWQAGTYALGEPTIASAQSQIGPFEFDFFCLPDSGTPGSMSLNLAADIDNQVIINETAALWCQRHGCSAPAGEQGITQLFLDPRQCVGQRRLRDIQVQCGGGQAAMPPDGADIFILAQGNI